MSLHDKVCSLLPTGRSRTNHKGTKTQREERGSAWRACRVARGNPTGGGRRTDREEPDQPQRHRHEDAEARRGPQGETTGTLVGAEGKSRPVVRTQREDGRSTGPGI